MDEQSFSSAFLDHLVTALKTELKTDDALDMLTAHFKAVPDVKFRRMANMAWEVVAREQFFGALMRGTGQAYDEPRFAPSFDVAVAFLVCIEAKSRKMEQSRRSRQAVMRKLKNFIDEGLAEVRGKLTPIDRT